MNPSAIPYLVSILAIIGGLILLARRVRKLLIKRTFVEYGVKVNSFELPREGKVEYARWLHPRDGDCAPSQQRIDLLRRYIAPGDTVLDIGAYTGDTTVPFALAAEKNGCVIALEPNPHVFKVLATNATLNADKTNIVPLNFAATSEDGKFTFHYSDASFCNGGFLSQIKNRRHGHRFALEVQGRNLSAYLRSRHPEQLKRLTYVKVDAEGFDRQVIASIADLLQELRPVLQCEVYKRLTQTEREALFDTIASLGYDLYKLEGEHDLKGQAVERNAMMKWKHFDIVAVPKVVSQKAAA